MDGGGRDSVSHSEFKPPVRRSTYEEVLDESDGGLNREPSNSTPKPLFRSSRSGLETSMPKVLSANDSLGQRSATDATGQSTAKDSVDTHNTQGTHNT